MLGLGETKLRELIKEGRIAVVMLDGKYLLLEGDLEAFLLNHYGKVREIEVNKASMPPLPKAIANSPFLRKAG